MHVKILLVVTDQADIMPTASWVINRTLMQDADRDRDPLVELVDKILLTGTVAEVYVKTKRLSGSDLSANGNRVTEF